MRAIIAAFVFCAATSVHAQSGMASVYGHRECGHPVASGGVLHCDQLTAAHRTFPFGSLVSVCRQHGNCVLVRIVDRGPYIRGRVIDLTPIAAHALGFSARGLGVAPVTLKVIQ